MSCQLSVVSRQSAVGNCQSAIVSRQSAVVSRQLSVGNCQSAIVSGQLSVGSCQLSVASRQLSVGNCQSAVGSRQLSVVSRQLSVGSRQLERATDNGQLTTDLLKIALILLIVLGFIAHPAYAQKVRTVTTEGVSSESFNAAMRDAWRSAVEQGTGVFIRSDTEIRNFEIKKDTIFSRTEGYILRSQILHKKKDKDIYKVTIRADVSLDKVKNDLVALKILLETMERPRLMVLIEENYEGLDFKGIGLAEAEIISLLQEKGFELVDKAQVAKARKRGQALLSLAGDTEAAAAMGLMSDAQYILLGKAAAHHSGEAIPGSGLQSVQASIQLKILHSQSGLILGSVAERGAAAHISKLAGATEALRKASKKAVENYIVDKITTSFQDFLNNGIFLKVNVVGVRSYSQYKDITDFFNSLGQVASCKKEKWNKTGGLLVLDLRFKGMSEELADLADQKKVGEGTLRVEDFAPDKLDLLFQ
ncbi:hypothetical protein QUF80_19915 [Desulfococcaceae bacterium HSG8]|nr:hypothetical protein [Desulfococcaceae bacterium HSG8]